MNGVILGKSIKTRFWLDPRTKFMMLLVVNIVLVTGGFSGPSAVLRPALALLPFFLLLAEGRRQPALLYGLLILGAFSAEVMLVSRSQGIGNLMIVIFTGVITRYLPGLVMGYYVVTTTKVAEFIGAMEQMGLPPKIVIPFAVMLRFIPTVVEENSAINDAMRMRGIRLGGQRPGAMLSCCTHILHMQEGKIIDNRPLDACGRRRMLSYFLEAIKEPAERRERVV